MSARTDEKHDVEVARAEFEIEDPDKVQDPKDFINQPHAAIYAEAIARYPNDESIDELDEKKLKRKLDRRIIPLLGICYFFYVSTQSHLLLKGQINMRKATHAIDNTVCRQDHSVLCSYLWNQG